jgi:heat shock protein HslJ
MPSNLPGSAFFAAFATFAIFAAPLLAQTPPASEVAPAIPPVVWELVEMDSPGHALQEIAEPERYTVQFQSKDRVAVRAGCHQVVGTYTPENGVLDVAVSDSTHEACLADSHSEPFLQLLDAATGFEIDPDGFLIVSGEEGQLRLSPTLAGVVWEWQDVRGGDDSFIAPSDPKEFTLTFLPDGKLAILAGCSQTLGAYTVNGPTLELSFDGATGSECSPGSLAERYLRDLSHVSSHVFRDGKLYLALRADAGIMAFAARHDELPRATPQTG